MNMDGGWCTGSTGASEEATAPSNPFTEVSSNSSFVESHTDEHSESHIRRRVILKRVPPPQRHRLMVRDFDSSGWYIVLRKYFGSYCRWRSDGCSLILLLW